MAVCHVKTFAMYPKLGRLVPVAGMFPVVPFKHLAPLQCLEDRKPAGLPSWILGFRVRNCYRKEGLGMGKKRGTTYRCTMTIRVVYLLSLKLKVMKV